MTTIEALSMTPMILTLKRNSTVGNCVSYSESNVTGKNS